METQSPYKTTKPPKADSSKGYLDTVVRSRLIPYYQDDRATIYCGDNVSILKSIAQDSVDLTVTSPPYDNLRDYKGYSWDFERVATEICRVTKPGGVIVWVVGDATVNGSETLSSFKQAIYFVENCGMNLHDTMVYRKKNPLPVNKKTKRYAQSFEYVFVYSNGSPKTFNPIMKKCEHFGTGTSGKFRNKDGTLEGGGRKINETKIVDNVWEYDVGNYRSTSDLIAFDHPAIFPEQLAKDHILSWSNERDTVLDPFCGSGTTLKMAKRLGRRAIGIDISEEYCKISKMRITQCELF